VKNFRAAAENPGDRYGHLSPEKLGEVAAACADVEKWLEEMKAKQDALPKHEKPVLLCAEMEKKNQELARVAGDLLREPKPVPPQAEKKEGPPREQREEPPADEQKEPPVGAAGGPVNMDMD